MESCRSGGGRCSRVSAWVISVAFVVSIVVVVILSSDFSLVEEELGVKAKYVLPVALLQRNTIALADVRAGDAATERSESRHQVHRLSTRKSNRSSSEIDRRTIGDYRSSRERRSGEDFS